MTVCACVVKLDEINSLVVVGLQSVEVWADPRPTRSRAVPVAHIDLVIIIVIGKLLFESRIKDEAGPYIL